MWPSDVRLLGSINTSEHKTISVQVFVGRTFPGRRRIMSTRIGQSRCCHRMQFKFQFNSRPTKKIISIIVSTNYWPRLASTIRSICSGNISMAVAPFQLQQQRDFHWTFIGDYQLPCKHAIYFASLTWKPPSRRFHSGNYSSWIPYSGPPESENCGVSSALKLSHEIERVCLYWVNARTLHLAGRSTAIIG